MAILLTRLMYRYQLPSIHMYWDFSTAYKHLFGTRYAGVSVYEWVSNMTRYLESHLTR
jgi:hypothetical protein